MEDDPLLGAVLFAIGAVLVAAAYHASNVQSLLLGHVIAFNGVLLVVLGCRKLSGNPETRIASGIVTCRKPPL